MCIYIYREREREREKVILSTARNIEITGATLLLTRRSKLMEFDNAKISMPRVNVGIIREALEGKSQDLEPDQCEVQSHKSLAL